MKSKRCTDWEGREFASESAMCDFHNVNRSTYRIRLKKGFTVKEALTGCAERPVAESGRGSEDHLGNIYPSVSAKCYHYNIPRDTYDYRKRVGWSEKDALEIPVLDRRQNRVDHLGNTYTNIKEMCKHYGITEVAYAYRRRAGWTKEKALTTPLQR